VAALFASLPHVSRFSAHAFRYVVPELGSLSLFALLPSLTQMSVTVQLDDFDYAALLALDQFSAG